MINTAIQTCVRCGYQTDDWEFYYGEIHCLECIEQLKEEEAEYD